MFLELLVCVIVFHIVLIIHNIIYSIREKKLSKMTVISIVTLILLVACIYAMARLVDGLLYC